jgi:hypothetical protein
LELKLLPAYNYRINPQVGHLLLFYKGQEIIYKGRLCLKILKN